jgi:hypothetical protein
MDAAWAVLVVVALAPSACALDRSGAMGNDAGFSDGGQPAMPDGGTFVDSPSDGGWPSETGVEDDASADSDSGPCTGAVDGTSCTDGVCIAGSCVSADPTELPADVHAVHDTDSTTASSQLSLDDRRDTRWTSFPDDLPRYITYRLDRSYIVAGMRVDSGDWSHCGQSDIYLSTDGTSWGSPVVRYTTANLLPNGSATRFPSPRPARFVRIVANARDDGGSYCYIAEFRALVLDP